MITLTKLNGVPFVINCDLIQTIYENPDTTIHLNDGNLYIVKESMREVIEKTIEYKRSIYTLLFNGKHIQEGIKDDTY